MNRSVALRRLCWKEYRQLWPLIVMLAPIALVLQALILDMNTLEREPKAMAFFRGIPCLFAAGVGALLVSQEKDNRTLYWMASLPILKQDIIRVKFLAGIVGLAAVWGISCVILLVTNGSLPFFRKVYTQDIDLTYGVLYSLFLLVVSFATAWSFRSTFVGLLALVGVALAFTLSTNLLIPARAWDAVLWLTLIAASVIALGVGWNSAIRTLSPTTPRRSSSRDIEGASFFERTIVDKRTIQTPWSALIWQFGAQNRAILSGLTALFLISLFICSATFNPDIHSASPNILGACIFIAFIAVSWLGVVTFQGDNHSQRIRFLFEGQKHSFHLAIIN